MAEEPEAEAQVEGGGQVDSEPRQDAKGADVVRGLLPGAEGAVVDPVERAGEDAAEDENTESSQVVNAEIVEAAEQLARVVAHSISTSGPVPSAEELAKYSPDHQERIFQMAEAFSSRESDRRDKIVDAGTQVTRRQQWITPGMFILAFSAAIGTYWAWQNVLFSALFVSIPVLRVIGQAVIGSVKRRRDEIEEDDE